VISTSDNGDNVNPSAGSLRAAILAANAHDNGLNPGGAADVIAFAIPGAGPHTIRPTAELPAITDPVVIDGYTQAGATPNTNAPGLANNAVLEIELDGENAGLADGLVIAAASSTIRGLAINRFMGDTGISVNAPGGDRIQGNFIGTNLAGDAAFPAASQAAYGVVLFSNANIVGTDADGVGDAGEGNVIAGVANSSVLLGNGAANNVVAGNRIGTSAAGDTALNAFAGVRFLGAGANNRIGGTAAAERNLISGNPAAGIIIDSDNNVIEGNSIGTNAAGTAALPNGIGVELDNASHNTIGGTAAGAGNLIAYNSGDGLDSTGTSTDNTVIGNTIFGNGGYDTDLATGGTTNVAGAGSGSFFVAAGATLDFLGGYSLGAGSSFSGGGLVSLRRRAK
jgi:hypothetical protein